MFGVSQTYDGRIKKRVKQTERVKEKGVIAMTLEKTEERKRSECRGDRKREREGGRVERSRERRRRASTQCNQEGKEGRR